MTNEKKKTTWAAENPLKRNPGPAMWHLWRTSLLVAHRIVYLHIYIYIYALKATAATLALFSSRNPCQLSIWHHFDAPSSAQQLHHRCLLPGISKLNINSSFSLFGGCRGGWREPKLHEQQSISCINLMNDSTCTQSYSCHACTIFLKEPVPTVNLASFWCSKLRPAAPPQVSAARHFKA